MADSDKTPKLSAVVTCYRDEPALLPMHQRLTQVFSSLGVDYEIIFVNDGSPDRADDLLAALAARDDHVLSIEHSRNFGSQNAFVSGMELATGDAVILLDGDLQDPPELIASFFYKWQEGFEVVYGRRTKREGSPILELSAKFFYRVFRRLSDVPMPLDAGDFSLMDRRVVDQLLDFPESDPFLRGLRAWVGFRQTGVDYLRPERAFGRSTHSFLKNFWWAKKAILSFSSRPVEILSYLGIGLTALSLGGLMGVVLDVFVRPEVPHSVVLLAFVVALFGSLNLMAVALTGEYLIRALEQGRGRPRFIRKAIRTGTRHLTSAEDIERFRRLRSRERGHHAPVVRLVEKTNENHGE